MIVLTLVVALLNLAVGYWVAVHFGFGPHGLPSAIAAAAPSRPSST